MAGHANERGSCSFPSLLLPCRWCLLHPAHALEPSVPPFPQLQSHVVRVGFFFSEAKIHDVGIQLIPSRRGRSAGETMATATTWLLQLRSDRVSGWMLERSSQIHSRAVCSASHSVSILHCAVVPLAFPHFSLGYFETLLPSNILP